MNAAGQQMADLLRSHADEIQTRFRVRKLSIFGSVARGEAVESSDIDLLVEFEGVADFDGFMDLKLYLEDLLQNNVDLVTSKAVRPEMRDEIESEAVNVA